MCNTYTSEVFLKCNIFQSCKYTLKWLQFNVGSFSLQHHSLEVTLLQRCQIVYLMSMENVNVVYHWCQWPKLHKWWCTCIGNKQNHLGHYIINIKHGIFQSWISWKILVVSLRATPRIFVIIICSQEALIGCLPILVAPFTGKPLEGSHWIGSCAQYKDKGSDVQHVCEESGKVGWWGLDERRTKVLLHKLSDCHCYLENDIIQNLCQAQKSWNHFLSPEIS